MNELLKKCQLKKVTAVVWRLQQDSYPLELWSGDNSRTAIHWSCGLETTAGQLSIGAVVWR
jgi:hypothetical protein